MKDPKSMLLSNRYNIKASSLTESVVAMSIIAICIAIGISIYGNVLASDNSVAFYNAQQKIKELLSETKSGKTFEDEDYRFDSFTIYKKVEILDYERIAKIEFTLQVQNKKEIYNYFVSY